MRLLVIDDDPKFRTYISAGLRESGVECETAEDGQAALDVLQKNERSFDLILLDVMMPKRDGWEVLMDLREKGRETPVIFVTARDAVEERVKGLQLGADDYIIKPFAFAELLARVEAVVRRRKALLPIEYGDLKLDLATRAVWRGGRSIDPRVSSCSRPCGASTSIPRRTSSTYTLRACARSWRRMPAH